MLHLIFAYKQGTNPTLRARSFVGILCTGNSLVEGAVGNAQISVVPTVGST
jgi:hypothetical protein